MTITGTTFDKMRVTPSDDAALYHSLNRGLDHVIKDYKNSMMVSTSGLNMYVDTGAAIVRGRYIEVTEKETLAIPANTKGFLAIVIDLTQDNTSTGVPGNSDYLPINKQVKLQVVDNLVQQDVFKDGKIWMMPLVGYSSSGSSIAITSTTPTSYVLPTISGGGWAPYYADRPPVIWDFGEFYALSGYITRTAKLAAGAASDAFSLPSDGSFQPQAGSHDYACYAGQNLYNVYLNYGENKIVIGKVYDVTKTVSSEAPVGGWYSLFGIIVPKENTTTIDRNTTSAG